MFSVLKDAKKTAFPVFKFHPQQAWIDMTGYIILGGLRNIFSLSVLTYLTYLGVQVSLALLVVLSMDFVLYSIQVRYFIGTVNLLTVAKVFVFLYFANRFLLWGLYDKMALPIYIAQAISVVILIIGGYFYLRSKRQLPL